MPCVRQVASLKPAVVCEGSRCKRSSGLPVRWQSAHGVWRLRHVAREGSFVKVWSVSCQREAFGVCCSGHVGGRHECWQALVVLLCHVWQGSCRQGGCVFGGRMFVLSVAGSKMSRFGMSMKRILAAVAFVVLAIVFAAYCLLIYPERCGAKVSRALASSTDDLAPEKRIPC
jgi:hypothetical protein